MPEQITDKLPFISENLTGIGGQIKIAPEHFFVEEIPLYLPEGTGEHVFVTLERKEWNTRDLQKKLAYFFSLENYDVGCAGLKDRQALVRQTFSLRLPQMEENDITKTIEDNLEVKVLQVKRHRNKLKTGHLLGNRFQIVVSDVGNDALDICRKVKEILEQKGLPNYYGYQRFGRYGDNAQRGHEILLGKKRMKPWLKRLMISAYQSQLFNDWLALRMQMNLFETLLEGDIAKKTDTGGLFTVEDLEAERPRFEKREITYTGPVFGSRMTQAQGPALELEQKILMEAQCQLEMFKSVRAKGNRRPARIFLKDLSFSAHPCGVIFSFDLPKGSYATNVLREFMKRDEDENLHKC